MNKDLSYTQAIEELEAIVNEIESEDISIDQLSEKVNQASRLINICQDALKTTSEEVREILDSLNKENQQVK